MSHPFISPRRRPVRRARPTPEGQQVMLAQRTTQCAACQKWIIAGQDMIVLDYSIQDWVHDNTKCRANDTAGMTFL